MLSGSLPENKLVVALEGTCSMPSSLHGHMKAEMPSREQAHGSGGFCGMKHFRTRVTCRFELRCYCCPWVWFCFALSAVVSGDHGVIECAPAFLAFGRRRRTWAH